MKNEIDKSVHIAVVDDHKLFRKGLINLVLNLNPRFKVILECDNGKDFLQSLVEQQPKIDIAIIDMNMPFLDGHETVLKLKDMSSPFDIIALTMNKDEISTIKMIRAGVKGFLTKDIEPEELHEAILKVSQGEEYFNSETAGVLAHAIRNPDIQKERTANLTEKEIEFVDHACSEDTYKVIADKMHVSEKTIDTHRKHVFEKLGVQSRVGLVLFAIKNKLVSIDKGSG